jgi:hypothetical protein
MNFITLAENPSEVITPKDSGYLLKVVQFFTLTDCPLLATPPQQEEYIAAHPLMKIDVHSVANTPCN